MDKNLQEVLQKYSKEQLIEELMEYIESVDEYQKCAHKAEIEACEQGNQRLSLDISLSYALSKSLISKTAYEKITSGELLE